MKNVVHIAAVVMGLLLTFPETVAQGTKQATNEFRLIAHRGGVVDDNTAENSLQALQKAADRGYWMVEVDMRLTKDSVLIAHHDRDFERYYGVDTPVSEMTWKEISKLEGDRGNKVLKFEEALSFCSDNGLEVMVDNKIRGFDPVLFTGVVELLEQYNLKDNAFMIGTEESTDFFTGKIKLSCTRQQVEDNMKKPDYSPHNYYLFSGDITKEDVDWALANDIQPVGVINTWGPKTAAKRDEAKERAQKLKAAGVTYFQIDSVYDAFFK